MTQTKSYFDERLAKIERTKLKKLRFEMDLLKYRANPDLWLTERFGEDIRAIKWDEWGYPADFKWDGTPNPLYQAWKAIADGNWAGLESATSVGKTYILARIVLWFIDVYENPYVITTAPKQQQLTAHLWSEISRVWDKFLLIRPYAQLTHLRIRKDLTHPIYYNSAEAVGVVSGVGSAEESSTKTQGAHRQNMLIIIEETPGVKPPVMKALENTCTGTNNMILAVGNPDNIHDCLHQFGYTPGVKMFRASGLDHPNVVLRAELVPGAVTVKSINMRKEKYGEESGFYKSRVRGISPEQATDSVVKMKDLLIVSHPDFTPEYDGSWNAVGVDVANSESGDMAACAWFKGNVLTMVQEFQCENANHLAYNLIMDDMQLFENGYTNYHIPTIGEFNISEFCIGVDAVGVGTGTINTLYDVGIRAVSIQGATYAPALTLNDNEEPLYTFVSRRAQVIWELCEDIRNRTIKIDLPKKMLDQLIRELMAHKYITKNGKIAITKKDEIKKLLNGKSPNVSDCVAYGNHVRKGWYQQAQTTMDIATA